MKYNPTNIPEQLKALRQWVGWKWEVRNGSPTKPPYCLQTGRYSKNNDPTTWVDYESAVICVTEESDYAGIGFCFQKSNGLVGIDIDTCIVDGVTAPWADNIVRRMDSYSEISPSGTGIKIILRGTLRHLYGEDQQDKTGTHLPYKTGEIGIFDFSRYFTITGNIYGPLRPIREGKQQDIDELFRAVQPPPPPPKPHTPIKNAYLSDLEIVEKLRRETSGKGRRLWDGDCSGYTSQSEAEMALACKGVFYIGRDRDRLANFIASSGMARDKHKRKDYLQRTAEKCIKDYQGPFYDGNGRQSPDKPILKQPAAPKEDSAPVRQRLVDTIEARRVNLAWPWPLLTHGAQALIPGTVTVICGTPGSAKSFFVLQALADWHMAGVKCAAFFLESDHAFYQQRLLIQMAGESRLGIIQWVRNNGAEVRRLLDQYEPMIASISSKFWTSCDVVTHEMMLQWQEERYKAGERVLVIDPVTMIDSKGKDVWDSDNEFVTKSMRLATQYKASLVLVTHPRGGVAAKGGDRLDQLAGGRAYSRFTSTVIWLDQFTEPQPMTIRGDFGDSTQMVNRVVQLWKTREAPGNGWHIGYRFEKDSLRFTELGMIKKDK